MGDPNHSLLGDALQNAGHQNVPITPMMGGGMIGGGPQDSLLPQPAVPALIQPVSGGGIQTGGALYPTLTLKSLKQVQIVQEQPTLLTVAILDAYSDNRKAIWGTVPATFDESRNKLFHYEITTKEPVKIFYIYSWDNFLRFIKTISNDQVKKNKFIYIFVSKLDNITLFSLIFKKYIKFVTETSADVFFLYDRTGSKNQIVWDPKHREDRAEKKFLFLEPASISIPFMKNGKQENFLISPLTVPPSEVPKDFIGLTPKDTGGSLIKFDIQDDFYKPKSLFNLSPDTFYSIDAPKNAVNTKEYLRRKYILFTFEDTDPEPIVAPSTPVVTAPTPVVTPPTPVVTPVVAPTPAPLPLKPDPYVLKLKGTVAVRIGITVFEIRKPTLAIQKEWDEGTFSESENGLFADIGITQKFIDSAKGPTPLTELQTRKESLLKKRSEFLSRLVMNRCFKEQNLLLAYECEPVREFLQELYELLQIDRANLFRKTFSGIAPAIVSLQKQKIGQILFMRKEILSLLDGLLPISKMPKGSDMFDIKFLRTVSDLVGPGPTGPGAPGGLSAIARPGVGKVPAVLDPIGLSSLYSI